MKLSIIIPCYNAEPYINELLDRLNNQMNKEVEVIIVDDGSRKPFMTDYLWAKVIRQKNGGASVARNTGLDNAKGEFVAFIDADDLVDPKYIETILGKIDKENPDYIYLSWKTLPGGWNITVQLKSIEDQFPPYNLCVWNRVYRKTLIGKTRFNPKKLIAEDAEFIRKVELNGKKKAFISDIMYYYRSDTPDSLSKRFRAGQLDTKRVVYYFKHVTANMRYLIAEFEREDKDGEVILLTESNAIPELKKYAMIMQPCRVTATERRGEYTNLIEVLRRPEKRQVVMWTHATYNMGGLETFIYTFCRNMCEYYDILVLYDEMDNAQRERLVPYVECRKNDLGIPIECDTIIVNRIISTDVIPANIKYKKSIQMVHGVKHGTLTVPQNKDIIVSVSDAVKESFGEETKDSIVIRNMTFPEKFERPLLLVSTTRIDCADKGFNRMLTLANLMNAQKVPFLWICFTNANFPKPVPGNMVKAAPTLDVVPFVERADYLVQLSDGEAFCYSIVEALECKTPVICTPLSVLPELGVKDGENGYVVPFDIPDHFDTRKFLKIPKFKYQFDNAESIAKWREVLGDTVPTHSYKYDPNGIVTLRVTKRTKDMVLTREKGYDVYLEQGEIIKRTRKRANDFIRCGTGVEIW